MEPDDVVAAAATTVGGSSSSSSSATSAAVDGKTFKDVVSGLFLTNKLSALQGHDVFFSGQNAGAKGVEKLAAAGAHGKHPKNLCRDLTRTLLKGIDWPKAYWATIPVKNTEDGSIVWIDFPFMLPHEVLHHLLKKNGLARLLEFTDEKLVREFCEAMGCDPAFILPLGLHGDGAPFAAKMRDSLEQFSWNLVADSKSSRIVFATIPKKFVCEGTFDAILEIFAWSVKQLLLRLMPSVRHDGTPFDKSDSDDRKKVAGEILPFGACLVQIRGDWAFYKGVFGFPAWNADQICWLCRATRARGSQRDFRQLMSLGCCLFAFSLITKTIETYMMYSFNIRSGSVIPTVAGDRQGISEESLKRFCDSSASSVPSSSAQGCP